MRAARVPRAERTRARFRPPPRGRARPERRTRSPTSSPGGEEQRVAIARALANRPGLLLADEPTGELDSVNASAILDLLERVRADRDATLVVVTHNPTVAARAGRHLTMRDGRIASDRREA